MKRAARPPPKPAPPPPSGRGWRGVIWLVGAALVAGAAWLWPARRNFYFRHDAVESPARFVELPGLGHNELVLRMGTEEDPVMGTLLGFMR